MKKLHQDIKDSQPKKPRTELDENFLAAVAEYMSKKGISSDRAMSIALGRKENFINRVRNGYQSATPEAWDALTKMSPQNSYKAFISYQYQSLAPEYDSNVAEALKHYRSGNDVDHLKPKNSSSEADMTNIVVPIAIYEAVLRENELLRSQLADKERIIQLLERSGKAG